MEKQLSVHEAILKRRASKVYLDEPAPSKADLDLITDGALWAPTAHNIQTANVIAITNKEFKNEVAQQFHEGNRLQVQSSQVVFILVGTPWKDDKTMRQILIDHSIGQWGLPTEEMVNNVADGTVQYYGTGPNEFKDVLDSYGSVAQMSMMMVQAAALGYDTNGMLGFDSKGLAKLLVEKGLMNADQRVNMTFTMGHRDETHQNNKLAHNRISKDKMIKIVE